MIKVFSTILVCLVILRATGQIRHNTSLYTQVEYNYTLYDLTKGNNPWSLGFGLHMFFKQHSKFRPNLVFTADAYIEDDKVLHLNSDGTSLDDLGAKFNLFTGASYHPSNRIYISLIGGPSLNGGEINFGIEPSLGFYFSDNQNWTGKLFYINIFNRDKESKADFGSIGLSLGVRLF